MSGPADPWDDRALLAAVRLAEEPALALEVAERLPAASEPRPVGVSDLLAPRRAFWRRRRGPAPIALERELRLELGRAWHRRLGDAVAGDGKLEVRLRRDGLSARIDLLADVPVEIKTGAATPDGGPPADWPDQVEQLAVYCVLVGSRVGRLAHLAVPEEGVPAISLSELVFRGLDAVEAEARRRQDALRGALAAGRPDGLGRCPWFDRGCEFRAAGLCDCRGDEPVDPTLIADSLERRVPRPEIAARWAAALASLPAPSGVAVPRFRDLIYPRRAYFERTAGRPAPALPSRPPASPLDMYERTVAALERGPVGEVHRLATDEEAPAEEVFAWRKAPCLLRSSRVRSRLAPSDVVVRFPQYLLDLGFRCAGTGTSTATLLIGYENPLPGEPPLQVFRLELPAGPGGFATAWSARRRALGSAVERGTPAGLPACPRWMATDCPYGPACGCSAETERSQR